jgi:hypothetical protein
MDKGGFNAVESKRFLTCPASRAGIDLWPCLQASVNAACGAVIRNPKLSACNNSKKTDNGGCFYNLFQ